jgi:hypothetical protein
LSDDIPNDSPSAGVTQCASPYDAFLFSGYGDPSMRADQLVTGGYGTNLWMLYSYPSYKWSISGTSCSNTTTVETHLAYSSASQGANGGQNWVAWCSGDECDTATPIWPSEPYCGSGGSVNGTPCTSTCAAGWATCFSSHEVPNFWPYLNASASPITESWVAVHLMYYVEKGQGITPGEIADGCLVTSMASTPAGLGWALGSGPNSCTPTTPRRATSSSNSANLRPWPKTGILKVLPSNVPVGGNLRSWWRPLPPALEMPRISPHPASARTEPA